LGVLVFGGCRGGGDGRDGDGSGDGGGSDDGDGGGGSGSDDGGGGGDGRDGGGDDVIVVNIFCKCKSLPWIYETVVEVQDVR